jgi:hypothetical protein
MESGHSCERENVWSLLYGLRRENKLGENIEMCWFRPLHPFRELQSSAIVVSFQLPCLSCCNGTVIHLTSESAKGHLYQSFTGLRLLPTVVLFAEYYSGSGVASNVLIQLEQPTRTAGNKSISTSRMFQDVYNPNDNNVLKPQG